MDGNRLSFETANQGRVRFDILLDHLQLDPAEHTLMDGTGTKVDIVEGPADELADIGVNIDSKAQVLPAIGAGGKEARLGELVCSI